VSGESSPSDLKAIWQNHTMENSTMTIMSIDELRLRARKSRSRERRDLVARWIFAAAASIFCAIAMWNTRSGATRVIAGLVLAMLLIQAVRGLHSFVHGSESSDERSAFLDFYRSELQRQQQFAKQPLWQVAAVLLIIGWLMRSGMVRVNSMRPVLIVTLIAAAGVVIMLSVKKFEARRIQKEIDALDQFEAVEP